MVTLQLRAYLQSGVCSGKFYVFGGFNGKECISDFKRIAVEVPSSDFKAKVSKVNIRKQLLSLTPKEVVRPISFLVSYVVQP